MNREKYPDGKKPQRCTKCRRKFEPSEFVRMRGRYWCPDCLNENVPGYLEREREFYCERSGSFDFSSCPPTTAGLRGSLSPERVNAGMRKIGLEPIPRRKRMEAEFYRASSGEYLREIHAYPERGR